jgi:hypothetical protein
VNPVILFRRGDYLDDVEIEAARKYLPVYFSRNEVPEGSLVIGRYSVLPYYAELEKDLKLRGSVLVNTTRQHQFIADIREWTETLGPLTFKTYHKLADIPADSGPLVVKGMTNSKKFQWDTHMFAKNKTEAIAIGGRLMEDSLFAAQEIIAREYVPLKLAGPDSYGFNGLPITEEYRFFVLNGQILSGAFYWSSHVGDLKEIPRSTAVPAEFLDKVTGLIQNACPREPGTIPHASFYALDIARTADNRWMVVEINDGQMSGLSENQPEALYASLARYYGK